MVIVALVAAWVFFACASALFVGRALVLSGKGDRWRDGHREVRDVRRLGVVRPVRRDRAEHEESTAA